MGYNIFLGSRRCCHEAHLFAEGPDWIDLERAVLQYVAGRRKALIAGKSKTPRQDIWKHLKPAAHVPGRLEGVLRRALSGELYVTLAQPPKKERVKKKGVTQAAPLLDVPKALQKAQERPKPVKATPGRLKPPKRFLALDVETTGRSKQDRVWELAVCCFEDGRLAWEHVRRFNPERKFEWSAMRVTGVSVGELRREPSFASSAAKIIQLLTGEVVVAHQLHFDKRMLSQEFARLGLEWPAVKEEVCTLKLARPVMKRAGKRAGLNVCCEHFNIKLENHHAAGDDARACGELFLKLLEAM